jgi:hypothetical protein
MKSMLKVFAVALVCVLAVSAFAGSSASLRLSNDVTVAGAKLPAGVYNVKIDGAGPDVKVIFEQSGQVKATVNGTISEEKTPSAYSSVTTEKTPDGLKVAELRLAKTKGVVKF